MISRSVAQIATASIRTSTSARFGTGTGFSVSFSSPGLPSTQARIMSGTGMSFAVFTPGGAYIVVLPYSAATRGADFEPWAPSSAESARTADTTCSRTRAR